MRGSKTDLPKTMETDFVAVWEADWGGMHVSFETWKKTTDVTPFLKGLPDDRDQCPHWGYVLKGRIRVRYKDREEVYNAGDAYYVAPGHTGIIEAGTEDLEFSPVEEYKKTMEVIERNLAAMQQRR